VLRHTIPRAPPGPAVRGRVVIFSPADHDGYVYDVGAGASTFVLAAGIVGGHGADSRMLGWLPD
jgi:hypothetical protein